MGKDRYVEAILLTFAVSMALVVIGLIMAQDHDFRAAYLFSQAAGLVVMLVVGARGRSQAYAKHAIIAALLICLGIDLWLSARGPVYLFN